MAPNKAALTQSKLRHELRALRDSKDLPEKSRTIAGYFLELMHHLAHNNMTLTDAILAQSRLESFQTEFSTFEKMHVLDDTMMEITLASMHISLQESLRALLTIGSFVPEALRYWKRQLKQPLELFLLTVPDKLWEPIGGDVPTDEKIRVLEETQEKLLIHIGEIKLLMLKWPQGDLHRGLDQLLKARILLSKAFSTLHIIRPRTSAEVDYDLDALPEVAEPEKLTIQSTLDYLNRLPETRRIYEIALNDALIRCRIPGYLRRRWWQLSIGAVGTTLGAVYVIRNRNELGELAFTMHKGIRDFVVDHMIVPITNIIDEVLLNKKALIQDPMALTDSKDSLQRMLADFIHDTNPDMPLEQQKLLVANMDMSIVSLQYEKELPRAVRNLLTGDIVRMMLIQIQFIKKELMVAMKAIDELMDANQLNMQMMATLPMFVAAGGIYYAITKSSRLLYRFTSSAIYESPKSVASQMRYTLRDIERLLNMQNTSNGMSLLSLPSLREQPSTSSLSPLLRATSEMGTTLGVRDMGYLVVLLDQLHQLFERNRSYFDEDEQKRFEEDLNDLVGEDMIVAQQLGVISRMHHSHAFLVKGVNQKWFE